MGGGVELVSAACAGPAGATTATARAASIHAVANLHQLAFLVTVFPLVGVSARSVENLDQQVR